MTRMERAKRSRKAAVSKRWSAFGEIVRKAPYFSGAMILIIGLYVTYAGVQALPGR